MEWQGLGLKFFGGGGCSRWIPFLPPFSLPHYIDTPCILRIYLAFPDEFIVRVICPPANQLNLFMLLCVKVWPAPPLNKTLNGWIDEWDGWIGA